MTTGKVQCVSCDARILESTKIKGRGHCTPCFMNHNHGFRPSDLEMLNRRGLTDLAIKWKELVRLGKPDERNTSKAENLNKGYSQIYQCLENYFMVDHSELKENEMLSMLQEMRIIANDEVKKLISKVEALVFDIVKIEKNAKES